jgi:ribosomal protein S18 acetylase RimI-like enzyme
MWASDIRLAGSDDMPEVMAGLRALATDLNDPFNASEARVAQALFGPQAYGFALLAAGRGLALCSPIFSTFQGATTVYVSDLWVADAARGQGLGRALLAAAGQEGRARWQADALRLTVYDDNARAMAFYQRLGFALRDRDRIAALTGAPLMELLGVTA